MGANTAEEVVTVQPNDDSGPADVPPPAAMSGRVAIVTGAARGIGSATARRLAADGLAVAVLDLEEAACALVADGIVAVGGRAVGISCDVSDEASVERAVSRVADELGPATVLVNNAGITRDDLLFKMSVEDWDAVIGVHLRGAFLMTRATQAAMVGARWGRIINISSISALGNAGQSNYAAAKAGLQGFTKTVALELGKFAVTANVVAPGWIATEMTRATAQRMGVSFETFQDQTSASVPMQRWGTPQEIAAAVSFFARDEAGFVTGQVLYVAGGPCD